MSERMRVTWALVLVCVVAGLAGGSWAQAPSERVTFTRDVAPILFNNCVACHRPGEVAPMSLRSYEETRPWATAIKEKVSSGAMPPWFADPAHGTFSNDARLEKSEIATITRWVDQGAPRGALEDLPELPELQDGWQMGEPDHIIELPEVTVPATGNDYFPDLSFTADVPNDEWVRAVEIRPSNREVAHHVVIFMTGGRSSSMEGNFDVLGVWAVGSPPNIYPEGMGRRIKAGQRFTTNMHYHPNGREEVKDTTRIGLYFGKGELQNEISAALAGSVTFSIPAGAANHEELASWYVDRDINIVSLFPHMHLRGKDMKLTAVYPDGNSKTLLNVPEYDFNWQLFYYPEEEIFIPAGSRIDIEAHYDNSADNPSNPDPSRDVYFGVQSTDEMMFGLFEYVFDEDSVKAELTDEGRLKTIAKSLPEGEAYEIAFQFGTSHLPSLLHLPREGDGKWILMFNGMQIVLPVTDVEWQGDSFAFDAELKFGEMGGAVSVEGELADDGSISGDLSMTDENTLGMMMSFKGARATTEPQHSL